MKDSERLREEIAELEAKLTVAIQQESFTLICDAEYGRAKEFKDAIGFFDITKLKRILKALHEGKVLVVEHLAHGRYRVYMNPQRNRIFVYGLKRDSFIVDSKIKKITESTIINYMLKYPCDWYAMTPEYAMTLWPDITL